MRPLGFHSPRQKRDWFDAIETGLSPVEYLASCRLLSLKETVASWDRLNVGVMASIDEDGDIMIHVTDPQNNYRFFLSLVSSGLAIPKDGVTPESLAAYVTESAASDKQDRKFIREIAEFLRDRLAAEFPRLATVPVDLVSCHSVNAWAQPVPAGGDMIVLHQHFIRCWVWCEWFGAHWLESIDSPWNSLPRRCDQQELATWRAKHASVFEATGKLAKAIMGIGEGANVVVERFASELSRNDRGDFYAKMMCMVALLHEYGHIALGHTDWLRDRIEEERGGRESSPDLAQMRKHEYAADEFAARALREFLENPTGEGLKLRNHLVGFSTVFLFHLFHHGQQERDDEDPDATHPAPLVRLAAFFREMGIDSIENIAKLGPNA